MILEQQMLKQKQGQCWYHYKPDRHNSEEGLENNMPELNLFNVIKSTQIINPTRKTEVPK